MTVGVTPEHIMSRRRALTLIGASVFVPLGGCKSPTSSSLPTVNTSSGNPLYYASLQEVARRIQSRDLSPVELTHLMLERIASVDPRLKSYATVMSEHALAYANMALQEIGAGRYRGPLHGVPVAVKDLCYSKGVRTMGGTASSSRADDWVSRCSAASRMPMSRRRAGTTGTQPCRHYWVFSECLTGG